MQVVIHKNGNIHDNHINNLEVKTMNILGDYITAVQRATDLNDHTGAIVLMAQYVAKKHNRLEGVDKLFKSAQAVETLHDFYGHMPDYLNKIRDEVAARCESFMTEGEVKAFQEVR